MAKGATYVVQFRRKREGRTDYKQRLDLLKSRGSRLVARKSNARMLTQIIDYSEDGDKVILCADSNELKKYGWKYSGTSIPAAYLTGFLCAKKAIAKGKTKAIMDIGLQVSVNGSRLYAVLKGAIDGGLEIPADESVFPDENRLKGQHIADYAQSEAAPKFTGYKKAGADPKDIPSAFEEVKNNITNSLKG
jgi:large subunit ribosomal protein L18